MKCERCGKEHDGSYATGRFCSRSCANSYSTLHDNKKETKNVKCVICNNTYKINKRRSGKDFICDKCVTKHLPKKYKHRQKRGCKRCGKIISRVNRYGYCLKCYNILPKPKEVLKKVF